MHCRLFHDHCWITASREQKIYLPHQFSFWCWYKQRVCDWFDWVRAENFTTVHNEIEWAFPFLRVFPYTITGASAGRLLSFSIASLATGVPDELSPKAIRLFDFSLGTSFMALSIASARWIWASDGVLRAVLGRAPKTRTVGHKSSVPIVSFPDFTAICRHYASVSDLGSESCILRYAARNGAWYHSTCDIVVGDSTCAVSILVPSASVSSINSFDTNCDPLSTCK